MAEKLALLGGPRAVDTNLTTQIPIVAPAAYKTINDMMIKGEISSSPIVEKFEKKFCEYIGVKYSLCCNNGTTTIQDALFAVGVGAGDEVIVPSFTFWASAGPVAAVNAVPVFADIDEDTQTVTAQTIERCITKKTKAIVVVHVWGNPCDMDPIMELAKARGIKVIEDCSHAHGAKYNGKMVGSIGDVGCFSMQGSKLLAAGEGGVMVTNSREYYERACALGHYERLPWLPDDSPYKKYALTGFGYKHRIHPFAAAIADAALDRLDELNRIRTENAEYLEELLSDVGYIKFLKSFDKAQRVYGYNYVQYLPEKLGGISTFTLLKALSEEGVCCGSCGYGKLHLSPFYNGEGPYGHGCPFDCPHYGEKYLPARKLEVTEKLADTAFMIAPRFETEDKEVVRQYAAAYRKILDNLEELVNYEIDNRLVAKKVENYGSSINIFEEEDK